MALIDSLRVQSIAAWRPTALRRVAACLCLARQRRALARLDAAALRDIGLTAVQAQAEASRPVWDAPAHWR